MATYELYVRSHFAAAHNLREYQGNCERLHGHNWQLEVVFSARKLDSLGMAMDFREAKRLLKQVTDELDHHYLNELEPFRIENPTTEHLAGFIYRKLKGLLPENITVRKVTAWESGECGASYSED